MEIKPILLIGSRLILINGLIIETTSVMPAKAGIQEYLNGFSAFVT